MAKKSQGAVSRRLHKIRNELDSLKSRATNRLNEVRQAADSQRYLDLLNQLQEAEREEDRAAKDLLNLYDQYQSKRMREETFKQAPPELQEAARRRHQPPVGPAEPGAEGRQAGLDPVIHRRTSRVAE